MCLSGFREEGVCTPGVWLGCPGGILTEQVSVAAALWLGTVIGCCAVAFPRQQMPQLNR